MPLLSIHVKYVIFALGYASHVTYVYENNIHLSPRAGYGMPLCSLLWHLQSVKAVVLSSLHHCVLYPKQVFIP